MKKEFEDIFAVLKNGSQEEVKNAKKRLHKLWHTNHKDFSRNAVVVLGELRKFDEIKNTQNQAAFVSGLSLFFLVLSDTHFQELKNFVLKVICHPNGHVREQMRKTADWLYSSLSMRIHPFIYPKDKDLTQKQIKGQLEAKKELSGYLKDIEYLIEKYNDPSYNSVDFIDQLKPSVYKSLELLWSDLTSAGLQKELHNPPSTILAKRMKVEEDLSALIQETKSDISLEEIQDIIYDETDFDDLNDVVRMFDTGSPYELQDAIEIINDAWNYFPHRILNDLCPAEVAHQKEEPSLLN